MTTINPWINFNGNAEEAFVFYRSVFGGEFTKVMRFKDMASPEFPVAEKDENRSKISVSTESKEEADKLFNGLSAGGKVEVPMVDSSWGSYFGMFRDKYGIEWVIEFSSGK